MNPPTSYKELVAGTTPPPKPPKDVERDLDSLIKRIKEREQRVANLAHKTPADPIAKLRQQVGEELAPVFKELQEKYSPSGITLVMDAAGLLQGGREITFELALGGHRVQLVGTATTQAIAFQETRHTPNFSGAMSGGPVLRLRQLNALKFRQFICKQLTKLVQQAARRR